MDSRSQLHESRAKGGQHILELRDALESPPAHERQGILDSRRLDRNGPLPDRGPTLQGEERQRRARRGRDDRTGMHDRGDRAGTPGDVLLGDRQEAVVAGQRVDRRTRLRRAPHVDVADLADETALSQEAPARFDDARISKTFGRAHDLIGVSSGDGGRHGESVRACGLDPCGLVREHAGCATVGREDPGARDGVISACRLPAVAERQIACRRDEADLHTRTDFSQRRDVAVRVGVGTIRAG